MLLNIVISWYVLGLIGGLMIDWVECKIVNRKYNHHWVKKIPPNTCYLDGIRPPAVWQLITGVGGYIGFIWGCCSLYKFYSGYYGDFSDE